jgi:hypothetical protein
MAKVNKGKKILHIYEMDAESIPKVQAFQARHLKKFDIKFGVTPETASIAWETPEQFRLLRDLAKSIGVQIK